MPNISKPILRQLNPLLDLVFTSISINRFDYHTVAVWPVNILSFCLESDGRSYFENMIKKQRVELRPGHVYFIPCGLKTHFEIFPENVDISLHFNLTFLYGLDLFSGGEAFEVSHDPQFCARVNAILMEKDQIRAICELKWEILRYCTSIWPPISQERLLASAGQYEAIFRHVRERGDASLTVSALAKMAGQRQNVFSRNFSRVVGKSPKAFLQDALVKKISGKLLMPDSRVNEVAAELNFRSEFYMSFFFKKHTGLSPREYQRRFRADVV